MIFNELDENSPAVKQPSGLKVKLRPHQLTSIAAMRSMEKEGSIVVDKPDINSGIYSTVKYVIKDLSELTGSTYVIETNAAILADKVGSGKTFMIIGLISNTAVPAIHDRFVVGTDHFSIKMITNKETVPVNLIVVPHNLANQWEEFLDQSSLKYQCLNTISDFDIFFSKEYVTDKKMADDTLTIYNKTRLTKLPKGKRSKKGGSKTSKPDIKTTIYEKKTLNMKKVQNALESNQVFILNVNRYRFFKQIFRSTKWARVIIDEMDSANIPNIFDEYGNFNWFLTATPTSIFYRSCRRYVNKIFGSHTHLLKYFVIKNKDEFVDQSIVLPKPRVFMVKTLLHRVVSAIQDLIPADVLEMINSGNMKEAVSKLNCDVDTEENIAKVLTDKTKAELHNLEKELEYVQSLIPPDPDSHAKRIEKIKSEIASCVTRLETVKERLESINKECCFICADSFETPTILDCCKNVFCLKCLLSSLKASGNKCPYCRQQVTSNKQYHVISKDTKKSDSVKEKESINTFIKLDKPDVLEKILLFLRKKEKTPRILIFSDYTQTFDKIIKNIAKARLQYEMLSGTPAHISNTINQFENGITNILLLDSQHYGSGLNLQCAQYLILYHRMKPELETQVIGRAQRYGREGSLRVIYLVNDSENCNSNLSDNHIYLKSESDLPKLLSDTESDPQSELEIESDKKTEKKKSKSATKNKKIESDNESNSDCDSDQDPESSSNSDKQTDSESDSSDDKNIVSSKTPQSKVYSSVKLADIPSDSDSISIGSVDLSDSPLTSPEPSPIVKKKVKINTKRKVKVV